MRSKEDIRKKGYCARCTKRGTVSCIWCKFNGVVYEKIQQSIQEDLREKFNEELVKAEHERMNKYLRDKYGER